MNLLSSLLAYTARQIAALRSADAATNQAAAALTNRVSTTETNITTMGSRLDTAISGVSSDTEVVDIRVGPSGKKYSTAGEAVRKQIDQVSDECVLVQEGMEIISYGTVDGEYPSSSGFQPYSGWMRSDYIPVTAGETIYINNPLRMYADNGYYDSDHNWVSAFSIQVGTPTELTIPNNVAYMVVAAEKGRFYGTIYRKNDFLARSASVTETNTRWKDALDSYVFGLDETFNVSAGVQRFYINFLEGKKYLLKNDTDGSISIALYKEDGTRQEVTGVATGGTREIIPDGSGYIMLSLYCGGDGSFRLTCDYSAEGSAADLIDFLAGTIPYKTNPNHWISSVNGSEYYDTGWTATDYIDITSCRLSGKIGFVASVASSYNAFYDSSKVFISGFSVAGGASTVTIPENAVYMRLSNTNAAMGNTVIRSIIGYIYDKLTGVAPDTDESIYSMNVDESMWVNASANYGFHSRGQSNVQQRFCMLVTTDIHGDGDGLKRAVDYMNDMPCFDCGVSLGDLQADTYSENDGTWYTNAIKGANKDWLTLIGNHDVGIGSTVARTGNRQQVYEKFIEPNLQYAGVETDKNYYLKDMEDYKIRLICLNAYDVDNDETDGDDYVVKRYTEYYSQAQINWFVDALINTPTDYHLMVLTHNTPIAGTKDTSIEFNNTLYNLSPESTQDGIIADIIDAWQRGVALRQTWACSNSNLNDVTVNADFSSRGTGVLICFLTGHMHVDFVGHITRYTGQNIIALSSTNRGTWQNDWDDLPRADNTKAEDCITSIAVDTTARKIYLVRIGSSVSRFFTMRRPSIISY